MFLLPLVCFSTKETLLSFSATKEPTTLFSFHKPNDGAASLFRRLVQWYVFLLRCVFLSDLCSERQTSSPPEKNCDGCSMQEDDRVQTSYWSDRLIYKWRCNFCIRASKNDWTLVIISWSCLLAVEKSTFIQGNVSFSFLSSFQRKEKCQ